MRQASLSKIPTLCIGHFVLAGSLDIDQFKGQLGNYDSLALQLGVRVEDLRKKVETARAVYSIVDHVRTLVFAISDGALPSNVGGGYNLRVILRRALDFVDRMDAKIKLTDVAMWHIDHLQSLFPELAEHRQDITTVLDVEEKKYQSSRERSQKILESLSKKKAPYDSREARAALRQ